MLKTPYDSKSFGYHKRMVIFAPQNTNKFVFLTKLHFSIFVKFHHKFLTIRVKPYLLWIFIAFNLVGKSWAQQSPLPVRVESKAEVSLRGLLSIYHDTVGTQTIHQVRLQHQKGAFQPIADDLLNLGYTSADHWVHFRLESGNPLYTYPMMLEVTNSRINELTVYQVQSNRIISTVHTGDELPFDSRIFPSRNFIVPTQATPNQPIDVYIRVQKRHEALVFQLRLWHTNTFEAHERNEYLILGGVAGFLLLIVILNLVLSFATHDRIYVWYIGLLLASFFQIISQAGVGFQYLWPQAPWFNHFDPQVLSSWLIMLAQLTFIQHFIRQSRHNSRVYRFVQAYKVLVVFILLTCVLVRAFKWAEVYWFSWMYTTTLCFILVSVSLAYACLFERIRKRESEVIFYMTVLSIQLIGYILVFLYNINVTRAGQPLLFRFDGYLLMVGILLIDLLILTMGLLYFRFNEYRRQNERLLIELHKSQQEQSERTIEALEMERNRIAEDLYDDVGAMLSTAIGYISSLLRRAEIREQYPILGEARKLLNTAIENLRTVSHNLMPKNFAHLGLSKSLEETVRKVSRPDAVSFQYVCVGNEVRLSTATEVQIFRIAADLIQNVIKQSGATEATLQLIYHPDYLNLTLEDNGTEAQRFVQSNLTSKVNFVHGNLTIDTSPYGSTVMVEIPISPNGML
ncbi:MAG: 7TM-DISM domain-containing protein [Spirosomataceae bacterium]